MYELRTVRGYDFYEVASALQKAIRRSDAKVAGYFALELWERGYVEYLWRRLFVISAEDCYGLITFEIESLFKSYCFINEKSKEPKGRVFISKAVILLCECKKSRDADHLSNLVYDRGDCEVEKWFDEVRKHPIQVPEYTYDVHTRKGKMRGKTKADFFREELEALKPREKGLFDDLVE